MMDNLNIHRSDSELQELADWYDYDVRGNVTVRKLPGRAAIHYRYDSAGRLVAEQDGNTSPRWQLYFYDRYGRVAVEAEVAWSDSELAAFLSTPCSVGWTGSGALGGYEPERVLSRAVDNTISKLNLGLANNVVNYIISGIKINHDLSIGGDPVYNLQRNILNLTPPGRNIYIPSNKFFPHDLQYFKFD